ncbi:MAG: hypothetical protein DMG57_26300 [Acidobacteria bacterium]|nr:MAG: hypothetical protein DMG57_26300 [Acidobacteriota bacterium]
MGNSTFRQASLLTYWYRQSPQYMGASELQGELMVPGVVTRQDPVPIASGMINVELDSEGRLTRFQAIPPEVEKTAPRAGAFDWNVLFSAAGLDPAEPEWNSLAVFDARAAWTGTWPGTERPLLH